jgi:hypothetical protein
VAAVVKMMMVQMMSEAETMADIYEREEMAASAADVNYKPADGDAPSDGVPHPPLLVDAPIGGPPSLDPTPPAPPKRLTLDEINDPRRVPIPSHYLKGSPEPWRPYIHWFI